VRDLKLEKSFAFERTPLYERLFALADAAGGRRPRELLPTIDLKSPKITRQLTTEWFARRVDGRYRNCLSQAAEHQPAVTATWVAPARRRCSSP
jgi:hypothetical protein